MPVQRVSFRRFTIETFAAHRSAGIEPGDEHQRVLRTVLDRQPEVGDLHEGRANTTGVAVGVRAFGALDGIALANRCPDETAAAGAERGSKVDPVRLDAIRCDRELALLGAEAGASLKAGPLLPVLLKANDRRHQIRKRTRCDHCVTVRMFRA